MTRHADSFSIAIRNQLAERADPTRAAPMVAYMKHRFGFFGVPTPERRAATRTLMASLGRAPAAAELIAIARVLWAFDERECQYVAVDMLVKHAKCLTPEFEPDVAKLVCTKSWWDTVDPLAARVYGDMARQAACLLPALDAYAENENLWLRRVAILYQLHYKRATDVARLSAALGANLQHPDFFIRKAMGWALRQYARTDPAWVQAWLDAHGDAVPALTRREASKHLPRQR